MKKKLRILRKWWRTKVPKYLFILTVTMAVLFIIGVISIDAVHKLSGIILLLLMTVPCSSMKINTNKKLWRLRQVLLFTFGILLTFNII